MAKDYKYPDSTPVDEPVSRVGRKSPPTMGIPPAPDYQYPDSTPVDEPVSRRRDGKSMMDALKEKVSRMSAAQKSAEKVNPMGDTYKAGGTASSRADGIAQRGKTRGTIVMCGGGYMKGKK
jgi:hypothetical protein